MDLNPDDIVGYRFKQSLRGYAIDEVDELLDRLADQIERMAAELAAAREKAQSAEAQSAAIRETEATLQRTLVVAQQAAERNLADASAQAEATLASATAEAERVRREAEEEATAVRTEADAAAAQTLEQAQQLARREVEAARSRVEEAASRHAEVLADVAQHRDALHAHLASLDELALEPPPAPRTDLVAGELPDDGWSGSGRTDEPSPAEPVDDWSEPRQDGAGDEPALDPDAMPLTVRVHEGPGGPVPDPPPLGSEGRDED